MKTIITANNKHHTAYALHCGYVEFKCNRSLSVEHGLYAVKAFAEPTEYFKTLAEARKHLTR